jgi:hypothetical protein
MTARPRLSEQEISRRLWTIYEMAIAAAERAKAPSTTDQPEAASNR